MTGGAPSSQSLRGVGSNRHTREAHCYLAQFIGLTRQRLPVFSAEVIGGSSLHHTIVQVPHGELKGVVCGLHSPFSLNPNNRGAV